MRLGSLLVDALHVLVAEDELVVDGVGVLDHEADGLAGLDGEIGRFELRVVDRDVDRPVVGAGGGAAGCRCRPDQERQRHRGRRRPQLHRRNTRSARRRTAGSVTTIRNATATSAAITVQTTGHGAAPAEAGYPAATGLGRP